MTVKEDLKNAMKQAMKAREQVKVDSIRSVLSAIQYEEMQKKVDELADEDAHTVVKREIKKRHEETEFAEKAARPELIAQLKVEIATIEAFLPAQVSEAELRAAIERMKSENPGANVGIVMKGLKEAFGGNYDAKLASELAKQILS